MDTHNYELTNNSSRDLQIMPIHQQHDHEIMNLHHPIHHQIPTHHDHHNPFFPNYPSQYYHSTARPLSSSTCLDLSANSNSIPLLLTSTRNEDHDRQELMMDDDDDREELGAMKELMYKIAAMQPVDVDPATIRKPRRRNVRISDDPQSVAARLRRERISERIRILQRLVPGGTKMDTASMLDEAIRYVKFLKRQIRRLQSSDVTSDNHWPQGIIYSNIIKWGFDVPNKVGHHIHGHVGSIPSAFAGGNSSGQAA